MLTKKQIKDGIRLGLVHSEEQNFFTEKYAKMAYEEEAALSDQNNMFCVCGRLATGFHERSCGAFRRKVQQRVFARAKAEQGAVCRIQK